MVLSCVASLGGEEATPGLGLGTGQRCGTGLHLELLPELPAKLCQFITSLPEGNKSFRARTAVAAARQFLPVLLSGGGAWFPQQRISSELNQCGLCFFFSSAEYP